MLVPLGIQEGKKDMAEKIVVEGSPRALRGKNEARRLRQTGKVPAVLYGGKGAALTLALNAKQVGAILRSESGHNTLFQVDLGGKQEPAILKDWLVDPLSGKLLHVDLLRVAMDVRMKVKVPVHTFGEPSGVKVQGGVFEVVTREVEIECLPADIPTEFKVDVSGLMLGKQLRANELPLDTAKMKLITEPERVLAHVVALKVEEEKPAEAVAAEAATPAEPEVIKKGKKEVEGEEGAETEVKPKVEKSDKGEKTDKTEKSDKSDKSDRSEGSGKSGSGDSTGGDKKDGDSKDSSDGGGAKETGKG